MAAAYETGTATSPIDLLQKLVTWLTAQGWTTDSSVSVGSGWRAHLHKGSDYVNFRASMNESSIWPSQVYNGYGIAFYMGTGYSGAANWNAQAGGPVYNGSSNNCGVNAQMGSGAITKYHFFDDGSDNVVAVIEITSGIFRYLGFGRNMEKTGAGSWTGGQYFFGSASFYAGFYATAQVNYPSCSGNQTSQPFGSLDTPAGGNGPANGFIRADLDGGFTGKWIGTTIDTGSPSVTGYTGRNAWASAMGASNAYNLATYPQVHGYIANLLTNSQDSRNVFFPIWIFAGRSTGEPTFLGRIPSLMYTDACQHGSAGGDVVSFGGENWMVFPDAHTMTSGKYNVGFAVKKAA